MWLCLLYGRQFEETFEKTQWRKAEQMQHVWLCILSGSPFEDTFENTQWRKDKQMQPVWLCILSGSQFEMGCIRKFIPTVRWRLTLVSSIHPWQWWENTYSGTAYNIKLSGLMVIQHWACVILISTHLVWLNTEWSTRWSMQDKIDQHGIRSHRWSRQPGVDVSHDHTRSIIWPKAKQGYRIFLGVATLFHFWPVLLSIQKWSCTFLQCGPPCVLLVVSTVDP